MTRKQTATPVESDSLAPPDFVFPPTRERHNRDRVAPRLNRGLILAELWRRLNRKRQGVIQPNRTILQVILQALDPEPMNSVAATWGTVTHDGFTYYLRDIKVVSTMVRHWFGSEQGENFIDRVPVSDEPDRYLIAFIEESRHVDIVAKITREGHSGCAHGAYERSRIVVTALMLWLHTPAGQSFLKAWLFARNNARGITESAGVKRLSTRRAVTSLQRRTSGE